MSPVLFLSHSGHDLEQARTLRDRLLASPDAQAADLKVWLDAVHLQAGQSWKDQIETVIATEATSFAVMVGQGGVQNWVKVETDAAMSRAVKADDFRFIPILMGTSSDQLSPFARRYHAVRNPLTDADALQSLLRAALGKGGDEGRPAITSEPFCGLRSMDETWADRFFGRERETTELIAQLRSNPAVAIVADSGAGKSSLAMAGVGAAWRGGALEVAGPVKPSPQNWNVVTFRPLSDPLEQLVTKIVSIAARQGAGFEDQNALARAIRSGDADSAGLALNIGLPPDETRTLLIVDQAEELFTQTIDTPKREAFCNLLAEIIRKARHGDRLRVLFTVRSDYAVRLAHAPGLSEYIGAQIEGKDRFRLKAMSDGGLRAMVTRPLRMAGFDDEAQIRDLADVVVRDQPPSEGDLALAQFALDQTWEVARKTKALVAAYNALNGVLGALGTKADAYIAEKIPQEERHRILPIFIRLIKLGDTENRAIRRTARLDEFTTDDRRLIARFASDECGRLLQVTETHVEISHEKLITQWDYLQDAIDVHAADIRLFNRLVDRSEEWRKSGQQKKYLTSLAEAESFPPLATAHPDWLSGDERAFLEKSRKNHRSNRRLKLAGVLSVVLLSAVSVIFFVLASIANREADQSKRNALAYLAASLAETRPVDAIKLALSAWPDKAGGNFPNLATVLDTVGRVGAGHRQLRIISTGITMSSIAFSGDGRRIVSGGSDGTLRLWDGVTGAAIRELLPGREGWVTSVAISGDGRRIVSGGSDGTLRLWDGVTGTQIGEPRPGHVGGVSSVAVSGDGRRIVSGGADGTVRLWDGAAGAAMGEPLRGHDGSIISVAVSDDGLRVVSGGEDRTVRLWDAGTGTAIGEPLRGHEGQVLSVAVSDDGLRVVSGGEDRTVRLWDAGTGTAIGEPLRGHEGQVLSVAVSGDGLRIVSGGADGTVLLRDGATGAAIGEPRPGHEGRVTSVALSGDGLRIVSGGVDGTVRLWDGATGAAMGALLPRHGGPPVNSVAISWDGSRIVSGRLHGTVGLWDGDTRARIRVPQRVREGSVLSVAISVDGRRIVSGEGDGTLRLFDGGTGARIQVPLRMPEGDISSVAISQDGRRIVSGGHDGTVRLWDGATGAAIGVPQSGHVGPPVNSVAISWDGHRIVSGGEGGTVRLWDGATGTLIGKPFLGHQGQVTSVAISVDGRRIVSGGHDGTVRLWDGATGAQIGEPMRGREGWVTSVAISGDGRRIVSGGADGTVRIWDAGYPKGNVFQIACQMLPLANGKRDLSLAGLADCDGYDPPLPDSLSR